MNRRRIAIWVSIVFLLILSLRLCVNFREPYEVGLTWNLFTGNRNIQERAGLHVRPPWVLLSTIDARPQRVCILSSSHAAANCKLVQFVPDKWREFLAQEGWRWYWWSNRFSFNFGHEETYRGMRDILRGYAFSTEKYPFVQVLDEYKTN